MSSYCVSSFNRNWTTFVALVLLLLSFINSILAYDSSYYDEEELVEFREMVKHLETKDFMRFDGYLRRWLYYSDFDLEKAYKAFQNALNWRKENNMDSILKEGYSFFEENYPYSINGFDRNGRPIMFLPGGTYDIRKAVMSGKAKLCERAVLRIFEVLESYLQEIRAKSGFDNITQVVAVIDFAGFNVKQIMCLKCVKVMTEMAGTFEPIYPVLYHRIFLINTPAISYSLINLAKNFVSEETKRTIKIFGYDKDKWSKALLEEISPDNLPIKYGGIKPDFDIYSFERRNAAVMHFYGNRKDVLAISNVSVVTNDNHSDNNAQFKNRAFTSAATPRPYKSSDFEVSSIGTVNGRESVKGTQQLIKPDMGPWFESLSLLDLPVTEEELNPSTVENLNKSVITETRITEENANHSHKQLKHHHHHHHYRKSNRNVESEQFSSSENFTPNFSGAAANVNNLLKQSYTLLLLLFILQFCV